MQILKSELDPSVNFIEEHLAGFLESRYVRRSPDYFVCYLSSHSGCNKGCRFCHLTATKQTSFEPANTRDFLDQARRVFHHYNLHEKPAKYVHFSFMARGEVLANPTILNDADRLLGDLGRMAIDNKLYPKFCLSTIMPKGVGSLTDIFKLITPTIYYSLYSMDEHWRKKWMPGAMPAEHALSLLSDYQKMTKKIVKIHFPFIDHENDSLQNIADMYDSIRRLNLLVEFNVVRYNPYSPEQGRETQDDRFKRLVGWLEDYFPNRVKVVNRVGLDVKASCGMFVQ